jgi:hypothetical protein
VKAVACQFLLFGIVAYSWSFLPVSRNVGQVTELTEQRRLPLSKENLFVSGQNLIADDGAAV